MAKFISTIITLVFVVHFILKHVLYFHSLRYNSLHIYNPTNFGTYFPFFSKASTPHRAAQSPLSSTPSNNSHTTTTTTTTPRSTSPTKSSNPRNNNNSSPRTVNKRPSRPLPPLPSPTRRRRPPQTTALTRQYRSLGVDFRQADD